MLINDLFGSTALGIIHAVQETSMEPFVVRRATLAPMYDTATPRSSRLLSSFAAALTIGLFSLNLSAAPDQRLADDIHGPDYPEIVLPAKAKGEAAIQSLGADLNRVAAYYKRDPEKLRAEFRADSSLRVDERGRLFHVCEWHGPETEPGVENDPTPKVAPFPLNDTFLLHSRPGATKLIYLDFDGHDASATSWGADAIGRPFDLDGNTANFSSTERERIQLIWQRVAEDFCQYEVDVTTEDPGVEALRKTSTSDANYGIRVVIGGSSGDWYGSAGGVAYLNSFDANTDLPCWVFPKSLGDSEKNIAEATSHEIGHTLQLSHDGKTDGTGYYQGQGNWAPIMGVGYYEPIVQWSKGEYNMANNTEDDLTKMLNEGIAYRADDHGSTLAAATLLSGVSVSTNGIIGGTTDVDYFRVQSGSGSLRFTVSPAVPSGNLHAKLTLYNSGGSLVTTAEAVDTTSGVTPVTLATTVAAGTYYLAIDGVGTGSPTNTGYSEYSSIGQYTLTGTLPSDSAWLPTAEGSYLWMSAANWASNTIPLGAGAVVRLNNNLLGDQSIDLNQQIVIGRLFIGDAVASHGFTIQPGTGGSLVFSQPTGVAAISKAAGTNDLILAPVVLNSGLAVTNSTPAQLQLAGPISGSGGITKYGAGILLLDGTNTSSGDLAVVQGTIALGASSLLWTPRIDIGAGGLLDVTAFAAPWQIEAGQMLSGKGAIVGDASAVSNSVVSPGANLQAGTLNFSNNLALQSGARLLIDLAANESTGGGTNDLIVVGGNLSLSGTVLVDFQFLQSLPASPGLYTIIQYGGELDGAAANFAVVNDSNRYSYVFDDSVPGEIRVQVTGSPLTNLVWKGDGAQNRWEVGGAFTWTNGASAVQFAQLDSVAFTDAGSVTPSMSLVGSLTPLSVTVDSSSNYVFAGFGKLGGNLSLTKAGAGTLTLNNSNDFTGLVTVTGGTLKAGNGAALGSTASGTIISSGRLDLNAQSLGAEPVTVQGAGIANSGAIFNSSATVQSNALRFVTLSGDTVLGGTGRWDIRANPSGSLAGAYNLTKTGTNEIWLAGLGTTGLRDINVGQGTLVIQGTTSLGDTTRTISVSNNASVSVWKTEANLLNKRWALNGSTLRSDSGNNLITGVMTLNGTATNQVPVSNTLEIQGAIGGPGSLSKSGLGILGLSAANTFDGAVLVSAGTLRAGNAAALGSTNGPTIISAGRLDVSGSNLGAEPVVVQGTGLGNSGVIVNYGASQINALRFVTLTGNAAFGGISRWDIRANPTGGFTGNNFNLTKTGPNEIWMVDVGPTELNTITVSEGILGLQGSTTLGNAASSMSVGSSGTLAIYGTGTNILSKGITLSGSRILNSSGSNTLAGTLTLSGSNRLDIASGSTLNVVGNVTGNNSLLNKLTAGTLVLSGNNTYSNTVITAGTLQVGWGGGSGTLGAGSVTNNAALVLNRSNDFTIANLIGGTGTVTKQGAGTATLSGANLYTGATTIQGGTLRVANAKALGATNGGTVIATGGALDINGLALGLEALNALGAGPNGSGAIINNAAAQTQAVSRVTLSGNTTFGGASRWDIRDAVSGATFAGGGFALTKTGPNQVWLANVGSTALGNIVISNGMLVLEGTSSLGNAGNQATIYPGASLGLSAVTGTLAKAIALAGGSIVNLAGSNNVPGSVTLTSSNSCEVAAGTTLVLGGSFVGPGSLTKAGPGLLQLGGVHSSTGSTLVKAGTLKLTSIGGLNASSLVQLDAGTTLDCTGLGTFVFNAGTTLGGNGTVVGTSAVNGVLAPGASVGRLTFNGGLSLAGTCMMEISKTGSVLTNDSVQVTGPLSLDGVLTVVHSGSALAAGDSFKLFAATTYSGSFNNNSLPPLAQGLRWDTSTLGADGTIRVTIQATQPTILPVVLDGTNLVVSASSETGVSYVLESADALQAPQTWMPIQTNAGTGALLNFSVPVDPEQPKRFFRLLAR